jgi:hypothetical protein
MKIVLPLSVSLPRKKGSDKIFILNLNRYRNANFHLLSQAKIAWKEKLLATCLLNLDWSACPNPPCHLIYTIYPRSGRRFDISNVLSIVEKFTDDVLVEYGYLPDDSFKIIPAIDYRFGKIDKENPRVELEVKPLSEDYNNLPF